MLINPNNKLDIKRGEHYFQKLIEGKTPFEIKKIIKKRSLSINAYMHVCITLYAIHFGYTLIESKTYLKRMCPFMIYTNKGQKFLKETSKMNNQECAEFVEWIRNFSSQNGCYIPDAEEYKLNKFNIDKEINNHKPYL